MRKLLSFRVVLAGLVVGVFGAGAGLAAAQGNASSAGAPQPSRSDRDRNCELPREYVELVKVGALTEKEACERLLEDRQRAGEGGTGTPDFPEGPSLVMEAYAPPKLVGQCRDGTYDSSAGDKEIDALYCNAILKVANGELEPNETCRPPECPEPGTPVWAYSEEQLRDLMEGER
jgi:hypothetical protein